MRFLYYTFCFYFHFMSCFRFYEFSLFFFLKIIHFFNFFQKKYTNYRRKTYLDDIEKNLINKIGKDAYFCILINNQTLDLLINEDKKIIKRSTKYGFLMKYLKFFTAMHTLIVLYYFSTNILKMKCPYPK